MNNDRCTECDQLSDDLANLDEIIAERDQRIAELEAANTRLREALKEARRVMAIVKNNIDCMCSDGRDLECDACLFLKQALADTKGGA